MLCSTKSIYRNEFRIAVPLFDFTLTIKSFATPSKLMAVIGQTFSSKQQLTLSCQPDVCSGTRPTPQVSHCPVSNNIAVDRSVLVMTRRVSNVNDYRHCRKTMTPHCVSLMLQYTLAVQQDAACRCEACGWPCKLHA